MHKPMRFSVDFVADVSFDLLWGEEWVIYSVCTARYWRYRNCLNWAVKVHLCEV